MACSVTGRADPATAVVPCVECDFSNAIGLLHPRPLANAAPRTRNGHRTPKSLRQPPDNQSGVAPASPADPLGWGPDEGSGDQRQVSATRSFRGRH